LEAGFLHHHRVVVALCRGLCLLLLCGCGGFALFCGVCGCCGLVFRNLLRAGMGALRVGAGGVLCARPRRRCGAVAAASAGSGISEATFAIAAAAGGVAAAVVLAAVAFAAAGAGAAVTVVVAAAEAEVCATAAIRAELVE
jgi:hypothetical protein